MEVEWRMGTMKATNRRRFRLLMIVSPFLSGGRFVVCGFFGLRSGWRGYGVWSGMKMRKLGRIGRKMTCLRVEEKVKIWIFVDAMPMQGSDGDA
ncbi:hypothetical protein BDZ94DRAFT_1260342 [Collybia nuda]|uniref:Transmembrane protein n=1 Tax=Collybia nuda TaxID=64659 RepID=A0A9P5Y4Z4_9AGAR|nr:hypothetical protein BDZ94DRAFT_1260342 [Collybia nuda]